MKKLLAAIALVLAFCLPVFALAACSDSDTIVGEQLQGEEQWKQAFADTMAARKQSGSLQIKETYSNLYTGDGVARFNFEKHIIANEIHATKFGPGTSNIIAKNYIELKENSIYTYQKLEQWLDGVMYPDNGWHTGKLDCDTEEAALEEFGMAAEYYVTDALSNASIGNVMSQKYATEETGESKDLSELFSAFTYNQETKEYSANLYCIAWDSAYPTEMTITFAGGKIAKYNVDFTIERDDGENEHDIREVICKYDVDITIPEEAKNGTSM